VTFLSGLGRRLARRTAERLMPARVLVFRGPRRGRRVALTFDDGPDPLTREYLDVLDHHGARATFFVLGRTVETRHDDLRDMVRRGHEVAGHGFTHKRFTRMSGLELRDELARTAALLPAGSGRALVRPPHGAATARSLVHCARAGYRTVLWSCDSGDGRARTAAEVVARLAPGRLRPGDIVLLHEGQSWTLEALPTVLGRLRDAGYAFATVSELL
jgi:peptidoglycan/xylan/chitin deacetylase (PgdA/CDA1 family)